MELEEGFENLSDKARYDFQLVIRAREGEQAAYAELMERYRDSIYFMLLKMVNNKDDADDLTIEAFGKAFNRLDLYTPNFAFSTWLFKIASNNCIDFIRKKKKNTLSIDSAFAGEDGDEMYIDLRSDALTPEEEAIKQQKEKLMRDVVQKLKPRYRQLIEMRYFQQLAYEEIAEQLDLPLGTVKAQLFRARDLLYQVLKNSKDRF
ncbi:MAG: RNA polymerase sigma factor [Flavobacteriales bacterium]|nr:RNA polymerase subunit sigma-24 [Flavobacteriales bacterium]HCA82970.1 RNA polymerase subunit sigma-24 [Flavobacteriales bacterium]HRE74777.1 sigma-70 family RNA polymerase sigma factor [Flavobacteriales bacterium]HRE96254.1 sigma-70 family RNA polymerase sigma factor [Flavobacteriales bacterium]HRJ35794.1 sigma-70 family RNA polymerase sigma factor [Flavobacteriales bacterium]